MDKLEELDEYIIKLEVEEFINYMIINILIHNHFRSKSCILEIRIEKYTSLKEGFPW